MRDRTDVDFLGSVSRDKLRELYASSHLLLSAKLRAPCPNIVLEAMASGLPVVCFDSGAHRELVRDAGSCLALCCDDEFDANIELDSAALAGVALEVLEHHEHFSSAACKRAEAEFNLDKMIDSYVNIFRMFSRVDTENQLRRAHDAGN